MVDLSIEKFKRSCENYRLILNYFKRNNEKVQHFSRSLVQYVSNIKAKIINALYEDGRVIIENWQISCFQHS